MNRLATNIGEICGLAETNLDEAELDRLPDLAQLTHGGINK